MMLKKKPSAKIKRRYLLIKGDRKEIEKIILDYLCILGWAKTNPEFVKQSGKNWILAIDRKSLEGVKAAFAVNSDKLEVLKVSGTLKGIGKN